MTIKQTVAEIIKFGVFDERLVRNVLDSKTQTRGIETLDDVRRAMFYDDMTPPTITPTYQLAPVADVMIVVAPPPPILAERLSMWGYA